MSDKNFHNPSKSEILKSVQKVRKSRLQHMWKPFSVRQALTTKDKPVRGPIWVSRTEFRIDSIEDQDDEKGNNNTHSDNDDNDIAQVVADAIRDLAFDDNGRHENYSMPAVKSVPVEWVGWRANVWSSSDPEPSLSERDKYDNLMKEVSRPLTTLYVFGGNFRYVTDNHS